MEARTYSKRPIALSTYIFVSGTLLCQSYKASKQLSKSSEESPTTKDFWEKLFGFESLLFAIRCPISPMAVTTGDCVNCRRYEASVEALLISSPRKQFQRFSRFEKRLVE